MNTKLLTDIARGLTDLAFPPVCRLCDVSLPEGETDFCLDCRGELMADAAPTCPRCAGTVGLYADVSDGCIRCREDVFHFQGAFRLGAYEGRLRQAILKIKREEGEGLADSLGRLLLEKLRPKLGSLAVSCVIPIPLHWLRRLQRGYNQAGAAAQATATGWGKPLRAAWLKRIKFTPAQTSLTPSERRLSPRQAFRARLPKAAQGQGVLLIDDVLTTGSTASAAARALKLAGAGSIWVAVLGKANS